MIDRVRGLPERRAGVSSGRRRARAAARRPTLARRESPRRGALRAWRRAWTLTAALGARLPDRSRRRAPDLAAASYRSDLFARVGFTLWDNSWYGGHHLLAYSLLAPALGALLGPPLLAALSMMVATALFATLIDGRFPRARDAHRGRCGSRSAPSSRCSPAASRSTSAWRIGLGALLLARSASRLALGAARVRVLTRAREPRRGRVPRAPFLAWALAGPARARAGPPLLALARSRRSRCSRWRSPKAARSRSSPRPSTRRSSGVLLIGALDRSPTLAQRVLRIGAALYALALVGAYSCRARSAATPIASGALIGGADRGVRARRRARALAPSACCSCSRRSCSTGRSNARWPTSLGRCRTRPSRPPTTRRCSASCARSASATARVRRASRWSRRPTTGRRAASPRR